MDNADSHSRPLLDPEQIKMLLESGADESIDLFKEILGMFEEESKVKFEEMEAARDSGDHEKFSRSAHALSGSSANIGGREVWLMAREMENLCKKSEGEKAIAMLPALRELYDETIVQMHFYVSQVQSGQG